jgi:hypothetical protein
MNYWVDVVFAPAAPTATPTGTATSTALPTSTSTSTATPQAAATSTSTSTATLTPQPVGTSTLTPTPIPPTGFTCTEIIGFSETEQWYDGGFIAAVPNPGNWQLRWYSGGSIDQWAIGGSFAGWSTSSLVSHCASGSSAPDRVILNVSGDYNTDASWWARQTQTVINYVRSAYSPNVKQIVVQPVVGGPASSLCGTASSPPTSWVRASYNFPSIKVGLQQVLSSSVLLGADPQVRSCADYLDNIGHLATAAQQPIGAAIAGYYSLQR